VHRVAAIAIAVLLLTACGSGGEEPTRAAASSTTTTAEVQEGPRIGDHIHLAYGIYVCDHWLEPLMDVGPDLTGIHTHGDGLVHVHPFSDEVTGARAVLGRFADDVGMVLADGAITLPDGTELADGGDCGGKAGTVRALVWSDADDASPEAITHDLGEIPLRTNGGVIALVFAPADATIELPRWAADLQEPTRSEEGKAPVVT